MNKTLLIVDDNYKIYESLSKLFIPLGYKTISAINILEAKNHVSNTNIDVVLLDVKLGNENGIDCFKEIKKINNSLPIIIITGYATIDNAIEAMKLGAFDYFKKPLDFERLIKIIENATSFNNLIKENEKLKSHLARESNIIRFNNLKMREIIDRAILLATTDLPILILGESGTGKEIIADLIHSYSKRYKKEIQKINCAAFPESLLDNELFGHTKGSFTGAISDFQGIFERANGSTLFLDEIGDMPLSIQAKILRVLQNNEIRRIGGKETINVNVRFIAATNKDLNLMINNNLFREDLYYRLNVATISIPPLRERKEDILMFCDFFLDQYAKENNNERKVLSNEIIEIFKNYRWPGNVRELKNTIMYIAAITQSAVIEKSSLPPIFFSTRDGVRINNQYENSNINLTNNLNIYEMEKKTIIDALNLENGNKKKAAERLGLSRNTLYRKLHDYGIYNYEKK